MFKPFIHSNFLLQNSIAEQLYHETAKKLPVIDYHNHLYPAYLASNHRFDNITQLWIIPDQYKHRAMRLNGIPEQGITGSASDKQKFLNWAHTFPKTLGNPLYHWSSLELSRIFGINNLLHPGNAEEIWETCNALLQTEGFSSIELLRKFQVELLCTSDDLLADLQPHISTSHLHGVQVLPSLRGDSMIEIDRPGFEEWLAELSQQSKVAIDSLEAYQEAIRIRLDAFELAGCRFADHALPPGFAFESTPDWMANSLFQKQLSDDALTGAESISLQSYLLVFLGKEYAARSMALQLHVGAQRETSARLLGLVGGAGGFASIGKGADIASIARFLDTLEQETLLPRVVLYTLNPADNEAFASLTGSFTEDGVAGKVQFGPAWWYNDHYSGLRKQLTDLASYGLLHHFIGMTTDSRSFLSFSRHEYFRRVFCNLVGEWVEQGHLPSDITMLQSLITAVCYGNIKNWTSNTTTIHVPERK